MIGRAPGRHRTAANRAPSTVKQAQAAASFSWAAAAQELSWLQGGALNIAHEAVDRHADGPLADAVALRLLRRDGSRSEMTYAQLKEQSDRFANVLAKLGVSRGERVFSLSGRMPELYVAAIGTLKHGCVFCPLFSAFGPEPIAQRLALGDGRVLVSTVPLYRRKVAKIRERLQGLEHVLLVGDDDEIEAMGAYDLQQLMAGVESEHEIVATAPDEMALLHFTSGTTGTPKGAVHVHEAVVSHDVTGRIALDLKQGDVFWCTADPGWVTGTSYGIISPLSNAVSSVVDEADFDAERWYTILEQERVNVWYTAPTALRMLMRAGSDLAHEHDLSALRFIASVGEPLNPEVVVWGQEAYGMYIHDNWWQTETGGIMIANLRGTEVRPGSMGRPLPGIEAAIARRDDDGEVIRVGAADDVNGAEASGLQLCDDGESGELVLRPGWPSMFRDYLGEHERYERCFSGGWYKTGDLARRDEDGWFWFVGRGDDVIKSSGHLIGPFEVESALLKHEAVSEAGVIGRPDEVAGEVVKAFVALNDGVVRSEELRRDLMGHARVRLGAAVAPREIEFVDSIPRNRSGKIMRRLLKARELGLPEGDVSTLER